MTHVIFDCDDVLLNWQESFVAFMRNHGVTLDPSGPATWDLSQWMGMPSDKCRRWVSIFNDSADFSMLKATPGAVDLVKELRHRGHEITVLTSCGTHTQVQRARYENLRLRFGSRWVDPFKNVIMLPLGESKITYLRRFAQSRDEAVYIEDNYDHAVSGTEAGITSYCIRRSHNRNHETLKPDSAVIWIDTLADFHRTIIQQKVD